MNLGYHMIGSTESTLALPKVSPGYVRNASTKNISDRKIKESRLGVREFAISDISDFRHVDHCRDDLDLENNENLKYQNSRIYAYPILILSSFGH